MQSEGGESQYRVGGVLGMEREVRERARTEAEARRAAGLGFWRLVWIVAFGILLAGAIAGTVVTVIRNLTF